MFILSCVRHFCDFAYYNFLISLLGICAAVVPKILASTGKVSNPYPNVDAHSGVILSYFGMKEAEFYTVLFGISRSIGVVSQLG